MPILIHGRVLGSGHEHGHSGGTTKHKEREPQRSPHSHKPGTHKQKSARHHKNWEEEDEEQERHGHRHKEHRDRALASSPPPLSGATTRRSEERLGTGALNSPRRAPMGRKRARAWEEDLTGASGASQGQATRSLELPSARPLESRRFSHAEEAGRKDPKRRGLQFEPDEAVQEQLKYDHLFRYLYGASQNCEKGFQDWCCGE